MTFQVRIQNLGKLADATVRVGPLTVLAGVNGTGKSFFSKFLYSVLDAMGRGNLVTQHVQALTDPIFSRLSSLVVSQMRIPSPGVAMTDEKNGSALTELAALARQLGEMSESIAPDDGHLKECHPEFVRLVGEASAKYHAIAPDIERASERNGGFPNEGGLPRDWLKRGLDGLARLAGQSGLEITLEKINGALVESLTQNFQVSGLSDLEQSPRGGIFAEVDGFGSFVVNESGTPDFNPDLLQLATHTGLVYLESPTLWKLQVALEDALRSPRVQRGQINGVPRYFYDLADTLRGEFTRKVAFPEVLDLLTSDQGIGGKVVRDGVGGMFFHEKKEGRRFPLTVTATGVANLGILALLIERRVLIPGTFLFIDEPESNLHPAWQVEMVRALFALARGGVNVVLATHSVDIVKYLEVHAKEHPEDKNLIALNHFTHDGVKGGDADFEDQLSAIQAELTRPFHKLYMRGL